MQNIKAEKKGNKLVLTIDTEYTVPGCEAGTPTKSIDKQTGKPRARVNDLVATSNGFSQVEGVSISLNVTRAPQPAATAA
jgi:hypothetical protein